MAINHTNAPNRFKVDRLDIAVKLARFWEDRMLEEVKVEPPNQRPAYNAYAVVWLPCEEKVPYFKEVCRAFVEGWAGGAAWMKTS